MGRILRWLKQLLTARKEEHKGVEVNRAAWNDGTEKERKRWSFVKQRNSGADGSAGSLGQAPAAESPQVRLKEDARAREKAAVVIQKTFRGYLARKALRALRSLVKIQALVRGYLVRKQAAMTLHRLQTLMRLQADSIAVKKASYRRSVEQEVINDVRIDQVASLGTWNLIVLCGPFFCIKKRIFAQEIRVKPPTTPAHRRRLSDSTDSNYERSPRIVEMDTCHLRSRSSRMTSRYTPDHSSEYHRLPAPSTPSCSPLPGKQQPARLSFRRCSHERERDPRGSKTVQNTPRFASYLDASPSKSVVEHGLASTPRRASHRDALVSPRYMAGTASSAARTRCHSAPRQRQSVSTAELAPRTSLARAGTSRRSCSQAHGGFCLQCSDAARTGSRCTELSVSDEAARDYYLDSMW